MAGPQPKADEQFASAIQACGHVVLGAKLDEENQGGFPVNRISPAIQAFAQAIAADSGLANAWLGRGLCRIKQGDAEAGRVDLLAAAALEPHRSLLRSYLGKAFADADDDARATKELRLAVELDPADPTAWL